MTSTYLMSTKGVATVNQLSGNFLVVGVGLAAVALSSCNGPSGSSDRSATAEKPPAVQPLTAPANAPSAKPAVAPLQKLPDRDAQRTWAQAIVKGQKAHLQEFDGILLQKLQIPNLNEYEIGCIEGCDKFNSPEPLTRTVYVFPREYTDILYRFGAAWDETQRQVLDTGFKLEFDANLPPPTCTGASNPAPCYSMPFCASDGCGRKPITSSSCDQC
jgi:hypothetical protein